MSEVYDRALKVAVDALAAEVYGDVPGLELQLSAAIVDDATAVVKGLAAAGLLLPEGAKHRTELMLNWYFAGGRPLLPWGVGESEPEPLERLREMAYAPPVGAIGGEIVQRDSWVGPWSVVEPVAIQGADE